MEKKLGTICVPNFNIIVQEFLTFEHKKMYIHRMCGPFWLHNFVAWRHLSLLALHGAQI